MVAATTAVTMMAPGKVIFSSCSIQPSYVSRPAMANSTTTSHLGGRNSPPMTIKGTKTDHGRTEGQRASRKAKKPASRMRAKAARMGKPLTIPPMRSATRRTATERRRLVTSFLCFVTVRTLYSTSLSARGPYP